MEDDKIKQLFEAFQPELSSDGLFMTRLQRNMEAMEIVRQHTAAVRRRNRIAVAVAALSGFVAGVVLTLLFPVLSAWLSSITVALPSIGIPQLSFDGQLLSWLLIGASCVTIAINAYDITLSRLTLKESNTPG